MTDRARRIGRFLLVGGTGFLVDGGLTELLVAAGLHPLAARAAAFAVAVAVTYVLNRRFTFATDGPARAVEGGRYLAVNLAAMTVNYAVFAAVLATLPEVRPVLAVACGSAVALVVSYAGYSRFVFGRERTTDQAA